MAADRATRTNRDAHVEARRGELVTARHRARRTLQDLEIEVRTDLVGCGAWRPVLQAHHGAILGAAFLVGFLYGNRR